VLALPAVAMLQALLSDAGPRFEVVDDRLTRVPRRRGEWRRIEPTRRHPAAPPTPTAPGPPPHDDPR